MTTVGRFLMKKIAFLMNFIDKTRNEKHLWLINISARSLMLFFFQFTIWYLKLRMPYIRVSFLARELLKVFIWPLNRLNNYRFSLKSLIFINKNISPGRLKGSTEGTVVLHINPYWYYFELFKYFSRKIFGTCKMGPFIIDTNK